MSDTWYRDPLPPYEDADGGLWTLDGVCLNPALGPEVPPGYYQSLYDAIVIDWIEEIRNQPDFDPWWEVS